MTNEEWVRDLNQMIGKTREGRLVWQHQSDGLHSIAAVGEFRLVLHYAVVRHEDELSPASGSLSLLLCTADGHKVAELSEADAQRNPAGVVALRGLFNTVIVEPRQKSIAGFRSALTDL